MADIAYIARPAFCDIHKYDLGDPDVFATHDVRTTTGQWANVCDDHRATHAATQELGTGKGQRLIVIESPAKNTAADIDAAFRAGDMDALMEAVGDGDLADWI